MKNKILLVIVGALLMLSATVVNTMVSQPATPKSVKVLSGYLYLSSGNSDLESALNTYTRIGYVLKSSSYCSNGNYLIVLEKY